MKYYQTAKNKKRVPVSFFLREITNGVECYSTRNFLIGIDKEKNFVTMTMLQDLTFSLIANNDCTPKDSENFSFELWIIQGKFNRLNKPENWEIFNDLTTAKVDTFVGKDYNSLISNTYSLKMTFNITEMENKDHFLSHPRIDLTLDKFKQILGR